MEVGKEGADEEVIDVLGVGRPPQGRPQMGAELFEILPVGADGVGGGVALLLEVPEERGHRSLHGRP